MSVFRIDQLHSDLPYRSFGSWIATESNISIREVQVINSHLCDNILCLRSEASYNLCNYCLQFKFSSISSILYKILRLFVFYSYLESKFYVWLRRL